jgi:hypothetical protein
MTAPRDHDWYRARLELLALGLARDDVAQVVEEHVRGCDKCRAALAELTEENRVLGPPDAHLPEYVVVAWDRIQPELRGIEREIARRHLASCARCRDEIVVFGFTPEVPAVPELEADPQVLALLNVGLAPKPASTSLGTGRGTSLPRPIIPPSSLERPRSFWRAQVNRAGWWTAAATAAAALLLVPVLANRQANRILASREAFRSEPGGIGGLGTLGSVGPNLDLGGMRSSSSSTPVIALDPAERSLSLFAQPSNPRPGDRIAVVMLDSAGRVLARDTLGTRDFGEGRRIIWRSATTIVPGSYGLLLFSPAGTDTFRFRISAR